jgi:LAO/AO transport system kinase
MMLAPALNIKHVEIPVIKTIASQKTGIEEILIALKEKIAALNEAGATVNDRRSWLLAEKAFYLIQQKRMADVKKTELKNEIEAAGNNLNLYQFIQNYQQWK